MPDGCRGDGGDVDGVVQLNDPDGADGADVPDGREVQGRSQPGREAGADPGDVGPPAPGFDDAEAGVGHGTCQRVAHERGPVQQRTGPAGGNSRGHLSGAEHRGESHVPAGQGLAHAHDVRHHAGMIGREQLAGAAKAGGDLVEDEQQPVPVRRLPERRQAFGRVRVHAAGALEHRLDDDRRQFPGVPGRELRHVRCPRLDGLRGRRRRAGGRGAKTLPASSPGKAECMPSTGSQTPIAAKVSPW